MFSEVAFKAANIYHPRMFCQAPSAQNLSPAIGFKKRMDQSEIETEAKHFLFPHLMCFTS